MNTVDDLFCIASGLRLGGDGIWYASDNCNVSYPITGNETSFAVENGSFWFKHRNNCILSIVSSFSPEKNGAIFDIGGGNGFVSLALANAGFDVVLVEPGRMGAFNAKSRGLKHVICATTATAHFKPQSLSAVGLFDVIEHIENDLEFLQSINGLIKDGGCLYATVPAYSILWSQEDISAGHFRRYDLKTLRNLLQSAGFEVEFSTYIFGFLPVPIFLFRTLPFKIGLTKLEKKASNSSRDHAVKGGIIPKILGYILRREIENLDNKQAICFGGSCLIVAKKANKTVSLEK